MRRLCHGRAHRQRRSRCDRPQRPSRNAFPYLLEIRRERERRAEYKRQSRKIEELDPFELCCSFLGEHMDEEEREMLLDVISSVQGVK